MPKVRHIPLLIITLAGPSLPLGAITVEGTSATPVEIHPEASTGLEAVIVVPESRRVRLVHTASSPSASVRWYRFSTMGGAYAEEIASTVEGAVSSVAIESADMGYMIEENGRNTCYWVINYANHELELESLAPAAEQDCDRTLLDFVGRAGEIPYYTINGRRMVLSRELEVEYATLEFSEDDFAYRPGTASEVLESAGTLISVPAPLQNTVFTLTGDRFLRAWNRPQSIQTALFTTPSVAAETRATQQSRDNDNELKDGDNLGGSAPCEILFEATVSDAVIFTEWQISRSPEFGILENSFNEPDFTYTFRDNGANYVRFIANNADGTCEYVGQTFEIFIGESRLEIPNAFTPQSSPGVNDEWKVSYRSLVSYSCHIFNRLGKQLFSSTDPAQGWDGKIGGKYVPAGVYYYVIEALGADGVRYKRSGDINIINSRTDSTSSGNQTQE